MAVLRSTVRAAGASLIEHFHSLETLDITQKGPADFVSNADFASEKIIMEHLKAAFPTYGFLMEESGEIAGTDPKGHYWIVDPLDGTTNFLRRIPHFSISIALARPSPSSDSMPELLAGIIFMPLTEDEYSAEQGKGGTHNGIPLAVSPCKTLQGALIGTGTSYFLHGPDRNIFDAGARLCGMRCLGSAALDLAYVATGRYDAFWHRHLKPWDIAAGIILVREAGGEVISLSNQGSIMQTGAVLATNTLLSQPLTNLLL